MRADGYKLPAESPRGPKHHSFLITLNHNQALGNNSFKTELPVSGETWESSEVSSLPGRSDYLKYQEDPKLEDPFLPYTYFLKQVFDS